MEFMRSSAAGSAIFAVALAVWRAKESSPDRGDVVSVRQSRALFGFRRPSSIIRRAMGVILVALFGLTAFAGCTLQSQAVRTTTGEIPDASKQLSFFDAMEASRAQEADYANIPVSTDSRIKLVRLVRERIAIERKYFADSMRLFTEGQKKLYSLRVEYQETRPDVDLGPLNLGSSPEALERVIGAQAMNSRMKNHARVDLWRIQGVVSGSITLTAVYAQCRQIPSYELAWATWCQAGSEAVGLASRCESIRSDVVPLKLCGNAAEISGEVEQIAKEL